MEQTYKKLLEYRAQTHPNRVAVIYEDLQYTYKDITRQELK